MAGAATTIHTSFMVVLEQCGFLDDAGDALMD